MGPSRRPRPSERREWRWVRLLCHMASTRDGPSHVLRADCRQHLAASLIWGINTIFLLDAGLTNFEAFAANAFFTAGMVLFEIPTGIVADRWGRRASFLCGTVDSRPHDGPLRAALAAACPVRLVGDRFRAAGPRLHLLLWCHRGLAGRRTDRDQVHGQLEGVFARGQVVAGAMMLSGSVAGGYLAQLTNLGVPYVARAANPDRGLCAGAVYHARLGFTPIAAAAR